MIKQRRVYFSRNYIDRTNVMMKQRRVYCSPNYTNRTHGVTTAVQSLTYHDTPITYSRLYSIGLLVLGHKHIVCTT